MFVDESKSRGYVLAATVVEPSDLERCRRLLRQLCLRGQQRLHFTKESDRRRRAILSAICPTSARTVLYVSSAVSDKIGRAECLHALLDDVLERKVDRLVLEQDDALVRHDRQLIAARLSKNQASGLEYLHLRGRSEPLLWVSDAVAWCWHRGGDWRRRVEPLVVRVRNL